MVRDAQQLVAQDVLRRVPLACIADDDERKVAGVVDSRRLNREWQGLSPDRVVRRTARTMAARHTSVRDSAHEFHMPAAQFSVSKYQLIPQTGAVAAMTAAMGRPICSA